MSIDLHSVLDTSSHYFFHFFLDWKNLWGFIVVICCYRKADKVQCEPQLCPEKHSTFGNYLQESTFLLYKYFVRFLFMQQKLKVAEKSVGVLHNWRGVKLIVSGMTEYDPWAGDPIDCSVPEQRCLRSSNFEHAAQFSLGCNNAAYSFLKIDLWIKF